MVTSICGASVLMMRATVPPPAPPPTMTTLAPPFANAGAAIQLGDAAAASAVPPRSRPNSLRSIIAGAFCRPFVAGIVLWATKPGQQRSGL
jgi:hypothetical protein